MTQKSYAVSLISEAEAAEFTRRVQSGPENRAARKTMALPGGFEIVGEYFLTARDAGSGEVEWEHAQKNLITDFGRRAWMESRWYAASINFAPSTEPPNSGRYSIGTDSTQTVTISAFSPGVIGITHTKVWSTVFGAPGSNRTLGMIALGYVNVSGAIVNIGLNGIISYALLTPPKVQTTTQTLEVVYKVSMNPIA